MTLDEHIKKAEQDAVQAESDSDWGFGNFFIDRTEAIAYAKECRQLAEWLKELKQIRNALDMIRAELTEEKESYEEEITNENNSVWDLNNGVISFKTNNETLSKLSHCAGFWDARHKILIELNKLRDKRIQSVTISEMEKIIMDIPTSEGRE